MARRDANPPPPDHIRDPDGLSEAEIEVIEKTALRAQFQAALDFGFDTFEIFHQSTDKVQNIAEDISREMTDKLGGYQIAMRILGNVDYRKARYIILPDMQVRQALFIESKAEASPTSATLQMSETSMRIKQRRGGQDHDVPGLIRPVATYGGEKYLTTTIIAHYLYDDNAAGIHVLRTLTLAAVPNGRLQSVYNPNPNDTIWIAGRNAPSRGEDFRVRLSFARLAEKKSWRVQRIHYIQANQKATGEWSE